jgi:cytochrome c oxidase assembly protein subunit 15
MADGPIRLYRSAAALTAATFCLLVLGASVRVHGAGLACPDWPLCFGQVVPTIDFQVGLEFGHRVVAGLVSLGFLAVAVAIVRTRATVGRDLLPLVAAAAVVLGIQIVLGGLTVLHLLAEWTVASHLVTGNTFLALLLLLTLALRERAFPQQQHDAVHPAQRALATLLLAAVPVQLVLGGLVAATGAGLVCSTWPSCNGGPWFPSFDGVIGIQVGHRVAAWVLLGLAAANVAVARGPGVRLAVVAAIAVTAQGAIGVANVLLRLPVEVTLLHTAGAAVVVLSTTALAREMWVAPLTRPLGGHAMQRITP